jgi:hypothetical protein
MAGINVMRQTIHATCALILISLYLLLPVAVFAHGSPVPDGAGCAVSAKIPAGAPPCGDCPSSETHDGDCCESDCHCSCHAPLTERVAIVYSPFVSFLCCPESHPASPQVYLPIFVPPQNFSV